MRHIRVLVVGGPGLLREIVTHAVTSQDDMTLLPETVTTTVPLAPSQRDDADVVVYLPRDEDDESVDASLHEIFRQRQVLTVQRTGERARLYDYDLRLATELRGDLSPDALLEAVRRSASEEPD